jgi:hypothetical protein
MMLETTSRCTTPIAQNSQVRYSLLTSFSRFPYFSNSMAFISQFGEYNPGGGKDQVLKYLNESETQVTLAKKSLKTIIDALTS